MPRAGTKHGRKRGGRRSSKRASMSSDVNAGAAPPPSSGLSDGVTEEDLVTNMDSNSPCKDDSYEEKDGSIRRSERGRKPKRSFSPTKAGKAKRRRHGNDGDEQERGVIYKDDDPDSDSSEVVISGSEFSDEEEPIVDASSGDDYLGDFKNETGSGRKAKEGRKSGKSHRRSSLKGSSYKSSTSTFFYDENELRDSEIEELVAKGKLPESVKYKRRTNSIYLPSVSAEMLDDGDGLNVSVRMESEEDFKFVRAHPKTKIDHADREKVRQVIDAVKKRPVIWDQRLLCHTNVKYTKRAWQQVADELRFDPSEYPIKRIKQIWKNKKDYFVSATRAGTIATKWAFYDDLAFYRPCINYRLQHTITTKSSNDDGISEKFLVAKRKFMCTSDDKMNVLTYLLKNVHDVGCTDIVKMKEVQQEILKIFERNRVKIYRKYSKGT